MIETLPISVKTIEDDGLHLFVNAQINGKKMEMLIDTGASKTVFDRNLIREYSQNQAIDKDSTSTGLGTTEMELQLISLDEISFGSLQLGKYQAMLIDLSHVNETYRSLGYEEISGVLGSDLLQRLNARIDYGTLTLELHK